MDKPAGYKTGGRAQRGSRAVVCWCARGQPSVLSAICHVATKLRASEMEYNKYVHACCAACLLFKYCSTHLPSPICKK